MVIGLTQPGIEPNSTFLVKEALSTAPLIGRIKILLRENAGWQLVFSQLFL